jgi:hypothetical protein
VTPSQAVLSSDTDVVAVSVHVPGMLSIFDPAVGSEPSHSWLEAEPTTQAKTANNVRAAAISEV